MSILKLAAQGSAFFRVITGEGKIDHQTAYGKAPAGVAKLAKRHGVPCIALCGCAGRNLSSLKKIGIEAVFPISKEAKNTKDSMKNAAKYLEITAEKAISIVFHSKKFQKEFILNEKLKAKKLTMKTFHAANDCRL